MKNYFLLSLTKLLILEKMIELGYWKIRGLVGGARVMLEHAGAGTDSHNSRYGPYHMVQSLLAKNFAVSVSFRIFETWFHFEI